MNTELSIIPTAWGFQLALFGVQRLDLLLTIIKICVCYNTKKHRQSIPMKTFFLMIRYALADRNPKESSEHKFTYLFV